MALFSPQTMAENFTSVEANGKRYFQSRQSVQGALDMLRRLSAESSEAGQILKRQYSDRDGEGSWTGVGSQRISAILQTGLIDAAVKAFETANGSMEIHLTRAAPVLSPVGSSFSVGRVMMGHPKAAIIRPRTKLPPKAINLSLNVSAGLRPEAIAASMSRIAKAAWQYIGAGGIVELTVSFFHNFARPQDWNGVPHDGYIDTIKINPVSAAAYASAASGQYYRALSIPLAQALSGVRGGNDGLPLGEWQNPQVFKINGREENDAKALAGLKIS